MQHCEKFLTLLLPRPAEEKTVFVLDESSQILDCMKVYPEKRTASNALQVSGGVTLQDVVGSIDFFSDIYVFNVANFLKIYDRTNSNTLVSLRNNMYTILGNLNRSFVTWQDLCNTLSAEPQLKRFGEHLQTLLYERCQLPEVIVHAYDGKIPKQEIQHLWLLLHVIDDVIMAIIDTICQTPGIFHNNSMALVILSSMQGCLPPTISDKLNLVRSCMPSDHLQYNTVQSHLLPCLQTEICRRLWQVYMVNTLENEIRRRNPSFALMGRMNIASSVVSYYTRDYCSRRAFAFCDNSLMLFHTNKWYELLNAYLYLAVNLHEAQQDPVRQILLLCRLDHDPDTKQMRYNEIMAFFPIMEESV